MSDIYDMLSTDIAQEVEQDLRNEDELMFEKDVDELIWSAAMEVCKGDVDHYDVIDMAKAKIESSLYRAYGVPA